MSSFEERLPLITNGVMTNMTNSGLPVSGRARTPQIDRLVWIAGVTTVVLVGAHNEVDRNPGRRSCSLIEVAHNDGQ